MSEWVRGRIVCILSIDRINLVGKVRNMGKKIIVSYIGVEK